MAINFPADKIIFAFFDAASLQLSALFRMFLGLWCVQVDPCFVGRHKNSSQLDIYIKTRKLPGIVN